MQYLGIDWGTRRATWAALTAGGELTEGAISADEDGLMRLVAPSAPDVRGCIEMMSGAPWVRDRLTDCGANCSPRRAGSLDVTGSAGRRWRRWFQVPG